MKGVKFLGHSVHPMLIVFPLGLLATSVVFDVLNLITARAVYLTTAFYLISAGLLGGVGAAVFGWLDWFGILSGTRAKLVGLQHGITNTLALGLFFGSWLLRSSTQIEMSVLPFVLSVSGFLMAGVGGWLGGELVERLGVSVHRGADVNAPSSLTTDMPE